MKLEEISADERFLLENVTCERLQTGEIISEVGRLEPYGLEEFMFRNRSESFVFRITESDAAQKVRDLLARNFIGLASVSSNSNNSGKKIFLLRIIFFMRDVRFGHFQIILGIGARNALAKKNFDVQDYGKLAQDFQFSDGVSNENCFAFVSAIPPAENPDEESASESAVDAGKVFQIQGRGCTLLVRLEGEGVDSRGVAYRAIFKNLPNLNEKLGLQLAHGEIIFSDEQSFIASKVREILHETPSYITTWNAYANREGDFLLKRARAVGTISYLNNFNHTESGLEITVVNNGACDLSYVSVGDVLEFRTQPPQYIADKNMSWADYQKWKNQLLASGAGKLLPRPDFFEVAKKSADTLTLKTDKDLAGGGNLYFSINGDEKQIRRRTIARERIENGTSASPNLGLILGSRLEDSTRRLGLTEIKRTVIKPRSALLNEKIFRRNEPTINQVAAIDIALNTPDIAVIQGPPGTGKTTVITGILERLNEIANKKDIQPGQVLVTSFQHDAVQNVIERISINSLPTIKFGQRAFDDNLTLEDSTDSWLKNMLAALEEQHPQLKQTERERQLFNAYKSYASSPTRTRAMNFLQSAREMINDAELIKSIDRIILELEPPKISREENLLPKIYRIPTAPESFADGGREIFLDLSNELENLYGRKPTPAQAKLLERIKIAAMTESPTPEFFAEMLELKSQLIEKCKPEPVFEEEEIRADILDIYSEIKLLLQRPEDALGNVVYELYREIRDNPQAMRQSIAAYTFVFAATVQQSERSDIKRAKKVNKPYDENSHAVYDTVIVDEAARVAPGDLMIPLSQAAQRIILVGDQRQLPHIYDEEIFQSLLEENQIESEDDIKVSMFDHLWQKAHELEKSDGIKRSVTLDAQYRMHPTLGNFVSRNFYEPYNEGFISPRPASDFAQNIFPGPVCWVNIPASHGVDRRSDSRSLFRQCEVDYIAEKISEYVSDPANEKLTFGAVSFYRAQAQAIKKKLKNFGSRVRIGTVDEFQGMEFDVMFLSVVRSGKTFDDKDIASLLNAPPKDDAAAVSEYEKFVEKIGSRIYGFLTMDNRLCVALSRQKRLLIVVGDAAMFDGEKSSTAAKICVPSMFNLYQLCKSEGGVINVK